MEFDFNKAIQESVEKKQAAIQVEATIEVLSDLFSDSSLTLIELKEVLEKADSKGLLDGLRLGQFIENKQSRTKSTGRITPEERNLGMQNVLHVLSSSKTALSKSQIIEKIENPWIAEKWTAVIRGLKKEKLIKDDGKPRSQKGYLISKEGKDWIVKNQ